MAGGANSRKQKSARHGLGTVVPWMTSYQPHTALPSPAIPDEAANSIHAGRNRLRRLRAYRPQEKAARNAAKLRPKSPMNAATSGDPQPKAAPTA